MNDAITAEIDDNSVDSETVDSPIESTEIPKLDPVVPKQPKQRKPTAYLYSYLVPHLIFHPLGPGQKRNPTLCLLYES